MKTAGIIILCIVGFIGLSITGAVVSAGLGLITIPWLKFTSQIQTNRDIVTKTYNADNALAQYHWFQETSKQLEAWSENIDVSAKAVADFKTISKGDMSGWTYAQTTEYARLNSVLQGQIQAYNSLAKEYDAKAGEADRGIFKDNLPLFFNLKPY